MGEKHNEKLTKFEKRMLAHAKRVDIAKVDPITTINFFSVVRSEYPEFFEEVFIEYLRISGEVK